MCKALTKKEGPKVNSSLKITAFYVMVERNNSASSLLKTKRLMKRQLVQGGNFDMNFLEHPSKCFGPPCFVRALPKKLRRWLKSIAKTPCWKGKNVQPFQRISMKYWKAKLIKKCTYRTRAIITHSWFETALDYKPHWKIG